jgi:hypothetical protein
MDSDLSLEFLRVVEQAAVACAHTMGYGDRHNSDHVAVEAMREVMDTVPIDGTIVIGEGERDEAPLLYIGEKVGIPHARGAVGRSAEAYDSVDIAVDPLEGTNLCATGASNAIAVLAAAEKGGPAAGAICGKAHRQSLVGLSTSTRPWMALGGRRVQSAKFRSGCRSVWADGTLLPVLRPRRVHSSIGDSDPRPVSAAVVRSGCTVVMGTSGARRRALRVRDASTADLHGVPVSCTLARRRWITDATGSAARRASAPGKSALRGGRAGGRW